MSYYVQLDNKLIILRNCIQLMTENTSTLSSNLTPLLPPSLVTLYLRLPNSQAVKIQCSPSIGLVQLKKKVAQFLNIPQSAQILYLKGKQLKDGTKFWLGEKFIVHIKDSRDMIEQMAIHIIRHKPQQDNIFKFLNQSQLILVSQQHKIDSLLSKYCTEQMDIKQSRIIECGRFLKLDRTFKEENVQQNTQIHIIMKNKIKPNQQISKEQVECHQKFIKKVLKHSRNNSNVDIDSHAMPDFPLGSKASERKNEPNLAVESQGPPVHMQHYYPYDHTCQKANNFLEKINPQLSKCSSSKELQNSFMNHTKSSEKWLRQKVKISQLTPLKLGLRQYKKYDGPLSMRGCNCKKKALQIQSTEFDECQNQQNQSQMIKLYKSQSKLKKSTTLIS